MLFHWNNVDAKSIRNYATGDVVVCVPANGLPNEALSTAIDMATSSYRALIEDERPWADPEEREEFVQEFIQELKTKSPKVYVNAVTLLFPGPD